MLSVGTHIVGVQSKPNEMGRTVTALYQKFLTHASLNNLVVVHKNYIAMHSRKFEYSLLKISGLKSL